MQSQESVPGRGTETSRAWPRRWPGSSTPGPIRGEDCGHVTKAEPHHYLDPGGVAEDEQQRHAGPGVGRRVSVQTRVVDVALLEPRPGHLALGVLAGLVQRLDLVYKPCKWRQR